MRVPFAVAVVNAAILSSSTVSQQGMGANAAASEVMNLLRSAPLTIPGETYDVGVDVPATFPPELIPEGASVGAVSVSPSTTVVVAVVKAGAPFERFRYTWALEDKGWITPIPPRVGFLPSAARGDSDLTLCRRSDLVTLMFRSASNGDRLVRAAIGKEPTRSCAPIGVRNFSDVPIPALELPAGMTPTAGVGMGGGIDDTYTRIRLQTTLTPAALAVHFSPQMTSASWKVDGTPVGDAAMSVTRFVTLSKNGDPITALLILTRLGETPYVDAMLRVMRQKPVIR